MNGTDRLRAPPRHCAPVNIWRSAGYGCCRLIGGEAVRKALRQLSRLDALAASALTRTRLIAERTGQDPATALGDLLRQAIDDLCHDPRSAKLHRALSVTFLHGTPTQQLAAERLGLPFTTYRRHLTAGIERICADLWHRELYGVNAS